MNEPEHDNVHDPSSLAEGEPPDEAFEAPAPTTRTTVIDGQGQDVVQSDHALLDILHAKDRTEAVFTALGAASTCWESMAGTGIFDSSRAKAIGDALVEFLDENDRSRLPAGELETFTRIHETSQRLRDKIEAETPSIVVGWNPHRRWRQLDDGTYVSDNQAGPPVTVVVERQSPADVPLVQIIGRSQDLNPGMARWLGMRLIEAAGIVETAVIP